MKKLACALAVISMFLSHAVYAQGWPQNSYNRGYTVMSPGQPPTFINPNPFGGGYTVTRPGQTSTFVNPNPIGGGYTVTTPGRPSTFINPNYPYGR